MTNKCNNNNNNNNKYNDDKQPDIVVVDKEEKDCVIIDIAVPADQNIEMKETEKMEKYQDLLKNLKSQVCFHACALRNNMP